METSIDARHPLAGELIEIAACRTMYEAAPPDLGEGKTAHVRSFGHVVARVLEPLSEVPMLNGIMGLGVMDDDAELELLAQALDWMQQFGIGGYLAVVPGSSAERVLREERGFEPGYAWMKFSFDLVEAELPEATTHLLVTEVGPDQAAAFGTAFADGYGMPPSAAGFAAAIVGVPGWHCYVAFEGDEPAGAAALFAQGGVAWLGMAGTRPAFRRRGSQGALLAARLRKARALGCAVAFTETGERLPDRPSNSYRNILRAGFREHYLRPNLVIPAQPGAE
jgi:GNAT superfamily N-acetyltransferase